MRECQAIDNDFLPACTRDQNRLLPFQLLGVVLSQPLLEGATVPPPLPQSKQQGAEEEAKSKR
jgi:hypothetical protein